MQVTYFDLKQLYTMKDTCFCCISIFSNSGHLERTVGLSDNFFKRGSPKDHLILLHVILFNFARSLLRRGF
jgi:hypothetical protein